jgi:hypothetical protein
MRKKPEPFLVTRIEYHTGDDSDTKKIKPERIEVEGTHGEVTYHIAGIMNNKNISSASSSTPSDVVPVDPKSDLLKNVVISKENLPMGANIISAQRHLDFFMDPNVPKLITSTSEDFEIKSISDDGKTFAVNNGIRDVERSLTITKGGISLLQQTAKTYTKKFPTEKTLAMLKHRRIVPKNPNVSTDKIAALNLHVASLMQRQ